MWDGEGRHHRRPSRCSCGWCKSRGATAAAQHFSYQGCSICSASSLPCTQSMYSTGLLNYSLGKKVSFLQQTAISEGSFQSVEGQSLLHGGTSYLCPAQCQLPAGDRQSPPAGKDRVPRAAHATGKLGLAMRSPPNLFLGSVFEDALGKHVSPSKRSVELLFSLTSPHVAGARCCSPDLISICREMRPPTAARLQSQK